MTLTNYNSPNISFSGMILTDLPPEIHLQILRLLDFRIILRCSLVCKVLYKIITTYVELQYVIELGAEGMVDGNCQYLSYSSRLKHLLDYRKAWANLEWQRKTRVPMPGPCHAYELVGDVFAKLMNGNHIHAAFLPSVANEDHQIVTADIGVVARDFAIDPTQDLIALVEDETASSPTNQDVRIYLRTLTTNVDHPVARSPLIMAPLHNPIRSAFVQIVGDVVGMFLCEIFGMNRVIIWNWKDGHLLVDHYREDLPHPTSDFSFLSSRAYILTSTHDYGSIHVYTFNSPLPSYCSPQTNPTHHAVLSLPQTQRFVFLQALSAHTGPFEGRCAPGKVFTTSPDSRVHVMTVTYMNPNRNHHFSLFVRNETLLQYIESDAGRPESLENLEMNRRSVEPIVVPWVKWGIEGTRFIKSRQVYHWLRYVQGQRVVCPPMNGLIRVLDFNKYAPLTHKAAPSSPPVFSQPTNSNASRAASADFEHTSIRRSKHETISEPTQISGLDVFHYDVISKLPFTVTTRWFANDSLGRSEPHLNGDYMDDNSEANLSRSEIYSGFMIDEQRIVGLRADAFGDRDVGPLDVFLF